MATRLTSQFTNLHDEVFVINIDDSSHSGAATEVITATPGFQLHYDGREMLDPITGSSVRIPLAVDDDTKTAIEALATDLLSASEERFTVKITRGGSLYWCGYVLPDFGGYEDVGTPYRYVISAVDGLARLKSIEYKNESVSPPDTYGVESFLDTVLRILNLGPLPAVYFNPSTDIFLRTSVNWVDVNIGAPTAAKCPLKYSRVNGAYVYATKRDNETKYNFKTCYEVLKIILEHWQCSIRFSNGCWRIQQIAIREVDLFYERRFSSNGTLVSSTANAGYDIIVDQRARARLAGGRFGYIQPLNEVQATYEHNTGIVNYTETPGLRWWDEAPVTTPLILSNIETDSTNYFRVTGTLWVRVQASNTTPWRWVMGMSIKKGGEYIDSLTFAPSNGAGGFLQVVQRTVIEWASPGVTYYEISSSFTTQNEINQEINFSFQTPTAPTSGDTIEIDFIPLGGRKLNNTTQTGVTIHWWYIKNPVFEILSTDTTKNQNLKITYTTENPTVGNSEKVSFKMLFGHTFASWTPIRIQTTSNLSTWVNTTDTWDRGTATDELEFGEIWVQQRLALQQASKPTWRGEIHASGVDAHTRIILTDNLPYCMLNGEYSAREGVWSGEWAKIGVNAVGIVIIKTNDGGGGINGGGGASIGMLPGYASVQNGIPGIDTPMATALAALASNYIGTSVPPGPITSLPLEYAVNANAYIAGDEIIVYDPEGNSITTLTVTTTASAGATSLSVSGSTTATIPPGAYVLYSPLNHYTGSGGGGTGGSSLPSGTTGQILRHNSTSWAAYSGSTDGYPLVWDTTNGFQVEQLGASGIADDSITFAKIQNITTDRLLGRDTTGTGDVEQLTVGGGIEFTGSTGIQTGAFTGDVTKSAGGTTLTIANDAVTFAKIQNISTQRVLGRNTGGTGDPEEVTVSQVLDWIGSAQGSILYRGASTWAVLTPGTSGHFLQTQGASANPTWAAGTGAITGSGSAGHVAYWTSATNLSFDSSQLFWDATNNRLGIGTASPTYYCHVGVPTGTSDSGLLVQGNLSANLNNLFNNVNNANAAANTLVTIATGGTSAGDPVLQLQVSGGGTWSVGLDNSDSDAFVIAENAVPGTANRLRIATGGNVSIGTSDATARLNAAGSGATSATYSLITRNSGGTAILAVRDDSRVGLLTTAPGVTLDIASATDGVALPNGTTAQRPAVNNLVRSNNSVAGLEYRRQSLWWRLTSNVTPTIAAGAAAGTSPPTPTVAGNDLCHSIAVTTGTSPTTGVLCTVTFNQLLEPALFVNVVFSAGDPNAASNIAKFYVSSAGNNSYSISVNAALSASTAYTITAHVRQ